MTIDANLYWIPEELFSDTALFAVFQSCAEACGYTAYMKQMGNESVRQIIVEKPKGAQNLNYVQGEYSLEAQLRDLDSAGVDKAVLKLPGCQEWLNLDLCRLFNDGMARRATESGGRLVPLAVIPQDGTKASIEELRRCILELGMHGVQISAHYGDKYLDDDSFAPMFEELQTHGMTAYVHHTPLPVEYNSLLTYDNLRRSYGRCIDQTTAVMRELLSGIFEKYPDVKLVHSMLGGAFHAFRHILAPHKGGKPTAVARFQVDDGSFERYLKKNVFFELSHAQPWGIHGLEFAVAVLGADHIVFGSSYPVRKEWLLEGSAFIRKLSISEEEKNQLLYCNAKKLYQID